MARDRSPGIPGLAVAAAAFGVWLVWSGIRDVSPVGGLRAILAGDVPTGRSAGGYQGASTGAGKNTGSLPKTDGPAGPVPASDTELVRGIRVHRSIAGNVAKLLDAADKAGIKLGGYGWRSTAEQRALRLKHGYPNDQMPSGTGGRLPVARPGMSMHERGLAIDFYKLVGRTSIKKGGTEFAWLSANAAKYGLYNLPSEAWHWSTNGN